MDLNKLKSFNEKQILVIGDYCMDEFFEGEANSVSPQAPILRVLVEEIKINPGMAGNIAAGISALGAKTYTAGIIGNDETSKKLISDLNSRGINTDGMVFQENRVTSKFSRVLVGGKKYPQQPAIRFDIENTEKVNEGSLQKIIEFIEQIKESLDAIIIAAYDEVGKGVIQKQLLDKITVITKQNNILLIGDSRADFNKFNNFDCIVPNLEEAESLYGKEIISIPQASKELISKLQLNAILITKDREGMEITTKDNQTKQFPAFAKRVVDVDGGGDTVTCAFTLGLCSGLDYLEAAESASYAAAVAVSKPRLAAVTLDELEEVIQNER